MCTAQEVCGWKWTEGGGEILDLKEKEEQELRLTSNSTSYLPEGWRLIRVACRVLPSHVTSTRSPTHSTLALTSAIIYQCIKLIAIIYNLGKRLKFGFTPNSLDCKLKDDLHDHGCCTRWICNCSGICQDVGILRMDSSNVLPRSVQCTLNLTL